MRKLILTAVISMCIAGMASAGTLSIADSLEKLPDLKQGVGFSLADSKLNYLSTIEVAKKDKVSFEVGYMGDADATDHKIVGVVSISLLYLSDYIDVPILDLIECNVGAYAGFGSINGQRLMESELDYGLSATLVNLKW